MKRQRPSNDDDDGGLDSLLDTMTNVVGILVLVLIVTQMSVADVVTRVTAEMKVDEEQIEELKKTVEEKKKESAELERMLVDPLDIDADAQREELQKSKELLERRKKQVEAAKKEKNDYAMKIAQDKELAAAKAKEIADTKEQREKMQTLIAQSIERKAKLQAVLDTTPKRQAPADVKVSIPNPRPAPPGSREATFICSGDRIYPIDAETFRKNAELKAKAIIARFRLDRDPVAGIDPKKFSEPFEKLRDQDEFFDVEYYVENNTWPKIRLTPRIGRGANESELLNPRSRIRTKWLSALDTTKYYGRFLVLPDSFDVYVAARGFFAEQNVLAGWEPMPTDWVYSTGVPGVRLGPPPPPPPKTTTPQPPPKPRSVID